jgi:hypothetical protein
MSKMRGSQSIFNHDSRNGVADKRERERERERGERGITVATLMNEAR